MIIAVYAGILVITVLMWLLSLGETLPDTVNGKGIAGLFNRMASWLSRRIWVHRVPTGSLRVQMYLQTLNPGADAGAQLRGYYIEKLGKLLMMITAGAVLSGLVWYNARSSDLLDRDSFLVRADYGEGDRKAPLIAKTESGEILGEYDLTITERRIPDDEIEIMAKEAMDALDSVVAAGNESLDLVTSDLDLVSSIEGYPFDISWKVENYSCMHADGSIVKDLPEDGGIVTLTATLSYFDREWTRVMYARVMRAKETGEEKLKKAIGESLEEAEAKDPYDGLVELPDRFGNLPISWSIRIRDNSLLMLVLAFIAGLLIYTAADRDLAKKGAERQHQMMLDYPQFISQLVLYLGAGMTVRSVFLRIASQYEEKRREGAPARYLYEEISRSSRELTGGMSEMTVYERLGIRCGAQSYVRLCTMLSQNLKRGNSELLTLLTEEARRASQERMDHARKSGEEAGTKLLFPMVMLLAVVMVVIMIPAYMSF